jgi:thioredoxin-dependent peroxiredoxin
MKELSVGDQLPSFTLPSDQIGDINIEDFKGQNIVLYFYPKDDTSGCALEANDFSNAMDKFADLNTIIIGISRDPIKKHQKFRLKYDLKHILLSDEDSEVCNKFGCWVEKSMYGKKYMGISRTTFLVDAKGVIKKIWIKVKVKGHVEAVIDSLK